MRILHTSDWHLGQHFMGKSRQVEHQAFIDWLIQQVQIHSVDVVLIVGDIFDSGAPPSYARELYNHLVVALHHAGTALVVLGGNHDSVATLSESRPLLAYLSTTVVPSVEPELSRQLLLLNDRHGQPGALLCAVAYIRPRDVLQSQAGQSAEHKQRSLQQAIHQHYQALYQLACERRADLGLKLPIIATGHLTTVGASASESVREIYVGALEAFPTSAFPPADYIALGHIHRPQTVGGQEQIRYSGSPIALSFDEAKQQKQVLLVDVDADGLQSITPLLVPLVQPLVSLSGNLEQLAALIPAAAQQCSAAFPVWLEVMVTADDYLSDLYGRIQALAENLPVELLRIRKQRGENAANLHAGAQETLDELTPFEVFDQRLAQETLDPLLTEQLALRYREIVDSLKEPSA